MASGDELATVFAQSVSRTVAGVTADWWTVEISSANGIQTLKFASLVDLDESLSGIRNAVHSIGFMVESDWEAVGQGFHADAIGVELPAKPAWATRVTSVADRAWSFVTSPVEKNAVARHYEVDLLENSSSNDGAVWLSQSDYFTPDSTSRTPVTCSVNIDQYDLSLTGVSAIADAISRAVVILAQEQDSHSTSAADSTIGSE
ncbi:hypothetical protein [Arthrobacter glacialis]|uniref:Uncharacterized protein n=1 Tax=Arthrobacter glacialis TaxID=1664 RepID=A0A2S4A1V9_ARTGL|nr:hypothetical protein [Arthrobacter glacialis]POH75374.1 hypothetical protein CVS27_01875 [Arthrobacter glacialis]